MARSHRAKTSLATALMGGCALAVLAGAHAQAQTAAPQAGGASTMTEIVVTAQKRSERLENVPMSVSALSSQALASSGVVGLHDLGKVVPGLQINFSGFDTQPAIRGVTTLLTGVGFENNVAVYVDGFYQPDSVGINGDLANLAGVEVLKGPQGTLYGRNATGGAILINTLDPAKTFQANIEGSYGRYNDWAVKGYVSAPINDKMGFNLAVYDHESDSYYRRVNLAGADLGPAAPVRQESYRAKFQVRPTDDLSVTFGYNYSDTLDPTGLLFNVYRYSPFPAAFRPGTATTASWNYRPDNDEQTNDFTMVVVNKTPIGDLTSHSSFTRRNSVLNYDYDGLAGADIFHGVSTGIRENTFQQSFDYNITAIPNTDLLIGASVYSDFVADPGQQSFVGGALSSVAGTGLKDNTYAGYIDATYHVTSALSLTAGGRYTEEFKGACYSETSGAGANLIPNGSGCVRDTFSKFQPRGVVRYQLAPRTNVYASITQGFRSGTFNPSPLSSLALDAAVKPEQITAYEVGFKTAQGRFRFDTSLFYYDYDNLQTSLTVPNPVTGTGTIQILANAKKAQIYGLDAELTTQVMEGLNVRTGLELLHAEYTDFHNAVGTGFFSGFDIPNQEQDWTGHQMARAPDFTFNLGADYTRPLFGGEFLATGNVNYTSAYINQNPSLYYATANGAFPTPAAPTTVLNASTQQRYTQPGYALVNVTVGWTDPSGHYTTKVYVNNLTNTKYKITNSGGAFGDYAVWGEPVSYGVKFGYKY
jgi:iron complex outermembrane receptor protein